jgi:fatty-acyl-CoA synthase
METPLSPLEFLRRARRLYPDREAVVDEGLRLTYSEFSRRCDRWSAALQRLGVSKGDRVAYIAPNTHALLESFYAIPQIGAVLVPINYRLIADDFAYIIGHSGAKVICAHSDYLEVVERIRHELPEAKHVVALEGLTDPLREAGWLDYETVLANAPETFTRPPIAEDDLLTINYTSGTTSCPKGVMITHRNAYMNVVGTLIHISMSPADRYLWTLPMFHANGWTFVWVVTAAGGAHVCLRKVEPRAIFTLIRDEGITLLCAAPTVLIGIANAPEDVRRILLPAEAGSTLSTKASERRNVRVLTAGAPPAAATIERIEGEPGGRSRRCMA